MVFVRIIYMIKLKRIISGMQVGADISALYVAKKFGLKTGGWVPRGWITQSGPHPDWAKEYEMWEHTSSRYAPRTSANVRDSDGTIRFAANFDSLGEICTMNAIKEMKKPHFDIDINKPKPIEDVIKWLDIYNIETLNVAGNAESTWSGISGEVIDYLTKLFEKMGLKEVK